MINFVELMADDKVFDQTCAHGCRVESYAVYCHSVDSKAPRKCQRTWATNGDIKDEDCPFFKRKV